MTTDGTILAAAADSTVMVGGLFELLGLVVVVAAVAALSRRGPVAGPIPCVLVGVALSYVPGVPDYRIDPNVVLLLFLPPLLYSAAWRTSNRSLRANLRPIALLSVGLVLFTTLVVGLAAWAVGPGLPLAAARARRPRRAPRGAGAAVVAGPRGGGGRGGAPGSPAGRGVRARRDRRPARRRGGDGGGPPHPAAPPGGQHPPRREPGEGPDGPDAGS